MRKKTKKSEGTHIINLKIVTSSWWLGFYLMTLILYGFDTYI